MSSTVEVEELQKYYGEVHALRGINLTVEAGTVLGLLGPNGAGKSTLVNILATLLRPESGRARVTGLDVVREAAKVRKVIGLAGQYAGVDDVLTGRENLEMVGRLYQLDRKLARQRADEVIERLGLADVASRPVMTYSGGMRRRLDLGASLVGHPAVLILDEPTTGLDPRTRLDLWGFIDSLVAEGSTLVLTTQYLEEADQLADSIAVIDRGRVIASGTSEALKTRLAKDVLEVRVLDSQNLDAAAVVLHRLHGEQPEVDRGSRRLSVAARDRVLTLVSAVRLLDEEHIEVDDIVLRRPSLDDVFLDLIGQHPDRSQSDAADKSLAPVAATR
jgi:ABC-2 type transport system ATP-binding protein